MNLVEDIMSRLSAKFYYQANMVNSTSPEYPAPPISGTAELLRQFLAQNQELMQFISAKDRESGRKNTNSPPTTSTGPCQGQPCHPMPTYFDKYCWTHVQGSHNGDGCNSKAPGHKEMATIEIRMDGSNYGCTEWRCGTVPKVATNNNRIFLLKSKDSTLVPPQPYVTQACGIEQILQGNNPQIWQRSNHKLYQRPRHHYFEESRTNNHRS